MIPVFRDKASLVRMPYLFGLSMFSVCKCFVEAFETMSEILAYSSLSLSLSVECLHGSGVMVVLTSYMVLEIFLLVLFFLFVSLFLVV